LKEADSDRNIILSPNDCANLLKQAKAPVADHTESEHANAYSNLMSTIDNVRKRLRRTQPGECDE